VPEWKVGASGFSTVLEYYEKQDQNQPHQWFLPANPSGMAEKAYVEGFSNAIWAFSGKAAIHMVGSVLSVDEKQRVRWAAT